MEEQESEWTWRSSFSPAGERIVIVMSSPLIIIDFFGCLLLLSLLNVECILIDFQVSINIECRYSGGGKRFKSVREVLMMLVIH